MAANWYDREKTLLSKVKVLAAVFTRTILRPGSSIPLDTRRGWAWQRRAVY